MSYIRRHAKHDRFPLQRLGLAALVIAVAMILPAPVTYLPPKESQRALRARLSRFLYGRSTLVAKYTASAAETWARSNGATEVEIEAPPLSHSNAYADRHDNDPREGARINKPSQGAPECVDIKISPSLGYRKNIT